MLAAALMIAPSALAATPAEIARDLADGKLDGTYTQAELTAFLRNAAAQGYEEPAVAVIPPPTQGVAGAEQVRGGLAGEEAIRQQGEGVLPFTGVDLALMAAGGIALLGIGAAMRRVARDRA